MNEYRHHVSGFFAAADKPAEEAKETASNE